MVIETNFSKKLFPVQNQKSHNWVLQIQTSLGVKFHPKQTIFNFWTKFTQKSNFRSNSLIGISLGTKFQLNIKLWIFGPYFPNPGTCGPKQKTEHHHQIQQTQIRLDTKFHPKQTILIFWIKFAQKGHFPYKKEVNINIKFPKLKLN